MKHQALFSLKDKGKKNKVSSAANLICRFTEGLKQYRLSWSNCLKLRKSCEAKPTKRKQFGHLFTKAAEFF